MECKLFPRFLALLLVGTFLLTADSSIEDLKKTVVETGKLGFIRDVPVHYLSRTQISSYITELFDKEYPDELAAKEEEFVRLMGFTSEPIQLKRLRQKIILENVGGMYNEKTKELMALEEYKTAGMMNTLSLIHEFRHAIQDQHFHLERLLGDRSDFDDRKLAILAAVEGDATFVMIKQLGLDPGELGDIFSPETMLSLSAMAGTNELQHSPDIVKYQLLMPYLDGLKFCSAIFARKKWAGFNRILNRPPASSEQILHPDKYLRDEKPMPVDIRFTPNSLAAYHSGVVGEYFLNILLKTGTEIDDAASGWGGDRFVIFKDPRTSMLIWRSKWDANEDCSRFFAVFRHWIEKKFSVAFISGGTSQDPFIAGESPTDYFFLKTKGNNLYYVRTNNREKINEFISGGQYD
jgi:hypothetical protein